MAKWKHFKRTHLRQDHPHFVGWHGDNLTSVVSDTVEVDGKHSWSLADSQRPSPKTVRQGVAPSVEAAMAEAEDAADTYRRQRGRPAIGETPMSSTERNRARINRLLAIEEAWREQMDRAQREHAELVTAGQRETAAYVAKSLRETALRAMAAYLRRAAEFKVWSGPQMPTDDEREIYCRRVELLADRLEQLVVDPFASLEKFEAIRHDLQRIGAYADQSLASAVAQAFVLRPAPVA